MDELAYHQMMEMASQPHVLEKTTEYLTKNLGRFLKRRDKVLICFPDVPCSLGSLMKEAVLRCGALPRFLGEDQRWMTLLKTAFITKSDAIIGLPLTMLGLAKVAKHMGTPLYARNVLVTGYPIPDWMMLGIERGLDCQVWGCLAPGINTIVAGFSCGKSRGIHLREDHYTLKLADDAGKAVPDGEMGRILLSPLYRPEICFDIGDRGRLAITPCPCGCAERRIVDIETGQHFNPSVSALGESLNHWSSVLDCRVTDTGHGIELELVVFPGEKLPKIPSVSKLDLRPWNPETDVPFPHADVLAKHFFPGKPIDNSIVCDKIKKDMQKPCGNQASSPSKARGER